MRRRPGGRSARVRDAVLRATLDAVVQDGVGEVTLAEVARRAGVHPTSIQRRWGTAQSVILDAMLSLSGEQIELPDTGTFRDDLVALLGSVARYLNSPVGDAVVRAMAAVPVEPAKPGDRDQFWDLRRLAVQPIFDRAIERGEITVDTDRHEVLELIVAPLHFRHLLTHEPIDQQTIERIADQACRLVSRP